MMAPTRCCFVFVLMKPFNIIVCETLGAAVQKIGLKFVLWAPPFCLANDHHLIWAVYSLAPRRAQALSSRRLTGRKRKGTCISAPFLTALSAAFMVMIWYGTSKSPQT